MTMHASDIKIVLIVLKESILGQNSPRIEKTTLRVLPKQFASLMMEDLDFTSSYTNKIHANTYLPPLNFEKSVSESAPSCPRRHLSTGAEEHTVLLVLILPHLMHVGIVGVRPEEKAGFVCCTNPHMHILLVISHRRGSRSSSV